MDHSQPLALDAVLHYHHDPQRQSWQPLLVPSGMEIVEVVTKGSCWIESDGEWLETPPGSLLWHSEGDKTISRSLPEDPYSCFAARIHCEPYCERKLPRVSFWPDVSEIRDFTELAVKLFVDDSFGRPALLSYLYARLLFQVELCHHRRSVSMVPEPLQAASDMVERDFARPLKMEDLARASGWSVPHLHDQFRKYFGTTPRQRLLRRRLRLSRELLVGSSLSVKQVAAKAGFTHSSAFCAAFKAVEGKSPKAYRDACFYGKTSEGKFHERCGRMGISQILCIFILGTNFFRLGYAQLA